MTNDLTEITYTDGEKLVSVTMHLDPATQASLQRNPLHEDLQGQALVEVMKKRGARIWDTVDAAGHVIAAERHFDRQTDQLLYLGYYYQGVREDSHRAPAEQHLKNGIVTKAIRHEFAGRAGHFVNELSPAELTGLNAAARYMPTRGEIGLSFDR